MCRNWSGGDVPCFMVRVLRAQKSSFSQDSHSSGVCASQMTLKCPSHPAHLACLCITTVLAPPPPLSPSFLFFSLCLHPSFLLVSDSCNVLKATALASLRYRKPCLWLGRIIVLTLGVSFLVPHPPSPLLGTGCIITPTPGSQSPSRRLLPLWFVLVLPEIPAMPPLRHTAALRLSDCAGWNPSSGIV